MALVSPGVSVTVTDESFFVPSGASVVPLFLIATAENKLQPNSASPAFGTQEHSKIRVVTSVQQSLSLYGVPRFLETVDGRALHGDARNEYGLFALNHFMGVGNRAYVVRANVNLNDDRDDILDLWNGKIAEAALQLEVLVQDFIDEYNVANGYIPGNPLYKETVTRVELLALIDEVMAPVFQSYNFSSTIFQSDFLGNHHSLLGGTTELNVYANGYNNSATGSGDVTNPSPGFLGVDGAALDWSENTFTPYGGSFLGKEDEWTSAEAGQFLADLADDYQYTVEFLNHTSLGANDAARRSAIVNALQAAANLPDLRAEAIEFNLILCPGYHEVADEMVLLAQDVFDEAVVIADTPMNMDPEQVVVWADSTARVRGNQIAYYYSHGLASNVDGSDVFIPASAIMARVIANNDNQADLWFAPAGIQRGVVTGVSQMGYVTGTLGTPTTFVEAVLSVGTRDNMYKYFTNLNPITFMPGRGIIVMGQKTSAPAASALDRVNVVRLMSHIRRQLRKNTLAFVFQPNDQLTRDNLKSAVDGFLANLVVKRALYDFASISDESNNTPDRIDRGEMYIDIALKPVKSSEFVYIPIRVLATGADI